jgi:hypothetical protein
MYNINTRLSRISAKFTTSQGYRAKFQLHLSTDEYARDKVQIIETQICMGWLRLVGSLKLQVSFGKEPYKRDYILQKRPTILRSLLIVATPYI